MKITGIRLDVTSTSGSAVMARSSQRVIWPRKIRGDHRAGQLQLGEQREVIGDDHGAEVDRDLDGGTATRPGQVGGDVGGAEVHLPGGEGGDTGAAADRGVADRDAGVGLPAAGEGQVEERASNVDPAPEIWT